MVRSVDAYIVQSERDERDLRRLRPGGKIVKTAHPTYAALVGRRWTKEQARRQLGLTGPTVLQFGFVRAYKGLDCLLRAVHLARDELTLNVLVVGEFWTDKRPYECLIHELNLAGHVTLVDQYVPNEDLGLYFGAADAVVLPYQDATQSGVAQLAFAFRRPVIASRVGGLSEAVDEGKTGVLVEPGSAGSLARGLLCFFRATDVDWEANIEQAEGRFAWSILVGIVARLAAKQDSAT
jgi:glycosyltransferase involved in cell wall biosynthesis